MHIASMEKNSIEDSIANNIEDAFGTTFTVASIPISPFNVLSQLHLLRINIQLFIN